MKDRTGLGIEKKSSGREFGSPVQRSSLDNRIDQAGLVTETANRYMRVLVCITSYYPLQLHCFPLAGATIISAQNNAVASSCLPGFHPCSLQGVRSQRDPVKTKLAHATPFHSEKS